MSITISNINIPPGCQKCKFFKKHPFGNGLDYSYSCILGAKDFPMPWIKQMEERASDCPIEPLEQEPCKDVISRGHLLSEIAALKKSPWYNDDTNGAAFIRKEAVEIIEDLCIKREPSVYPEPPEDAISRDQAMAIIYEIKENHTSDRENHPINYGTLCDINLQLVNLPSVNPQESKIGHWIYDNIANNWRCDKCGETPKTMGYVGSDKFMAEHFKFCNHCGAKMVEPQESEK